MHYALLVPINRTSDYAVVKMSKNVKMNAQTEQVQLPGGPYKALLLDLDGVITNTASVHRAAWKKAFDAFLERRSKSTGEPFVPFDLERDYQTYVDGKPRNNGVRDFLTSRNISLPEGDPESPPSDSTIWGIGNQKNELLLEVLEEQGVDVYEGTVQLIKAARTSGFQTAVVSSSANTQAVLQAANLEDQFDARVDGITIIEQHLAGKPAPDAFVEAAKRLGVEPKNAVVFEDALAGVEAGKAGNFGLVVGVDRVGQAEALKQHGADVVVRDLVEFLGTQHAQYLRE